MSLKEDLKEMADKLVADAIPLVNGGDADALLGVIMMHAAELRGVAKGVPEGGVPQAPPVDVALREEEMRVKARLSAQDARRRAFLQEQDSSRMMECVGGPADMSHLEVRGEPAEGSYTAIGGSRYQVRGGKLYYAPQIQTR